MKHLIAQHIEKGITYLEYRETIKKLVAEGLTSGNEVTPERIEFTKLNDRRMKRWDKTLKIPSDLVEKVKSFNTKVTWLVITESWCGDAAHLLPVFYKVATLNDNIDLKIVFRDENDELMNQFLTNGNRSIPKLIMIDNETNLVLKTYGSRPNILTEMVNDFNKEHGRLTNEFKESLQIWYNKDKGQTIIDELVHMLCKFQPNVCLEIEM